MMNADHVSGLIGGLLIGTAATLLLWSHGKIAGISGLLGGLLNPSAARGWRVRFLAGLLAGGVAYRLFAGPVFSTELPRSTLALAAAGLLVGFGTRWGGGCTSGHGVCGLGRLSVRSLAATVTFMLAGAATVFVVNRFFGGAL
jgi:uncharacterized membrane protein YedE/YeeE